MNSERSQDQLSSENPSILSEISVRQQQNYIKLKENSDLLANFIKYTNMSINDNPSVESNIMETPQRQDLAGIKSGYGKSSSTTPQTQRTHKHEEKKESVRRRDNQDRMQYGYNQQKSPNERDNHGEMRYTQNQNRDYDRQFNKESQEIEDFGNNGSSQLESKNDFDGENDGLSDIHRKGINVIKTIDNVFNRMKEKYNIDFSLQEMQKHLNIPDTATNSQSNLSGQPFQANSLEDVSRNISGMTYAQTNQRNQSEHNIAYNYEENADSIVHIIRNKIMNRQGNNQGEYSQNEQNQKYQHITQLQQTQDIKDKQIQIKKDQIKKKLSPAGVSNNPIDEIDDHNADLEIEKIKNIILNRNQEPKGITETPIKKEYSSTKTSQSGYKHEQIILEQGYKQNTLLKKQEIQSQTPVKDEKQYAKYSNNVLKNPLYSSSESDEEIIKSKNKASQNIFKNVKSQKDKSDDREKSKIQNKIDDEESQKGRNNEKGEISKKDNNSDKLSIKSVKSDKFEDESIKALVSIQNNKQNFKENIRKLKAMYKNNFNVQQSNEDEKQQNVMKDVKQQESERNDRNNSYSDDNQVNNNLEYSPEPQEEEDNIQFATLNPYSLQSEEGQQKYRFHGQEETSSHIYHNDQQSDAIQQNERTSSYPKRHSTNTYNMINSNSNDQYYRDNNTTTTNNNNQQYNLSGDEGGDMDSEVFNISPDHHLHHHMHHDNRLNSLPDDNRTLSIFNENHSLQASFLETSLFQRSPRQIQQGSNVQNGNKKYFAPSPSPIFSKTTHNNQTTEEGPSFNLRDNQRIPSISQTAKPNVQTKNIQILPNSQNAPPENSQKQINIPTIQLSQIRSNQLQQHGAQQDAHSSSFQQQNMSNLSYSQSMHDQSSIFQQNPKKQTGVESNFYHNQILGDAILPQVVEEEEKYQLIYERDEILQKLQQEKQNLEIQLRKWEDYLQELDSQDLLLEQ